MSVTLQDLRSRGWETKAGMLYAPTSRGGYEALWGEAVVEGPQPIEQDARLQYRLVRASLDPFYQKAWLTWLSHAISYKSSKMALATLPADERKALSEGTDTSGGEVVPAELAPSIISVVRERSTVRRSALQIPTVRDLLVLSQWDFAAEWVGEVPSTADTTVTPINALSIPVRKLRAKVAVPDDLIADQPAFIAWFTQASGDQLSLAEDRAFIAGSGPTQPTGMLNTLQAPTTDVTGTTASTISNTTAALGSAPKLIDLNVGLSDAYSVTARWFMSSKTLGNIRKLVDAQGRYIWISERGNDGEEYLMSNPVSTSSAIADDGATGRVIVFADVSRYIVATRALLTVRVDTETLGDRDQTLVYIFDRIGGQIATTAALRVGTVT